MKILVLGDYQYASPWLATYPDADVYCVNTHLEPRRIPLKQYDAIQFTGGADVSPALYGEVNTTSYNNVDRDLWETQIFLEAQRLRIPCFGICRGSQFLRVMCGGRLVQDRGGHAIGGTHMAQYLGRTGPSQFDITSTHHQHAVLDPTRFYDFLVADEVVEGWALMGRGGYAVAAVQYHPEYMKHDSSGFRFYQDVIRFTLSGEYETWCLD